MSKDWAGVRFAPPSRAITAASRDCGFTHEGEDIEAVVAGICMANLPEETVEALKMSIRMPRQRDCTRHC